MTARWHPTAALIGLPGMPAKSRRAITLHGPGRGWVSRLAVGGKGMEWLESSLPGETQAHLRACGDVAATCKAQDPAPAPSAESPAPSARAQAIADARLEILTAFDRWQATQPGRTLDEALTEFARLYSSAGCNVSDETRSLIKSTCRRTLIDWRKAQRQAGWQGLIPRHGAGNKGTGIVDSNPRMRDLVVSMIEGSAHVKAHHIVDALEVRFPGPQIPVARTVQVFMARYRREHRRELLMLQNPDAAKSRYKPAFGDACEDVTALNQRWELDSSPADVMCIDGRFALVAAIDVWSRRARVLVVPTSKAVNIGILMRRCIVGIEGRLPRWGVPAEVRTDEGKDYVSKYLRRVLADLAVRHDRLPGYSPEMKPFIERFFGTMTRDLFPLLPGFTGHNVADAQALRSRKSFDERRGQTDREVFGVQMGAEELQARVDAWIEHHYHQRHHQGLPDGMTPHLMAASWTGQVRTIENPRGLDRLFDIAAGASDGLCTVGKKGIRAGGTTYVAPELTDYIGEKVRAFLHADEPGVICVYDVEDDRRFICLAQDPAVTGVSRQEIAHAANKAWREGIKTVGAQSRGRNADVRPGTLPDEIAARRAEEFHKIAYLPRTGLPWQTPGLDEAARAQAANGPVVVDELTPDMQAAADRLFAEMEARAAAAEPRASAWDPDRHDPTNVVAMPRKQKDEPVLTGPGGRPFFHDDASCARWLLAHPHTWDDEDRAWLEDALSRRSFRDLLDFGDASLEDLVAAHRNA